MTPGWFTSTCLAVSSADAAIRRVGELGPYRLEADSRQKIKNKIKIKIYLYLELVARLCIDTLYDVCGAGAPWGWACVGNIHNFLCLYVCVTVGSACTVHDGCLIFFFHFLSEFAKLYFACILTRGLNNLVQYR